MGKPLELNTYPPMQPEPDEGWDAAVVWNNQWIKESRIRRQKRLTDAELAAECYRQMLRACAATGITYLENDEVMPSGARDLVHHETVSRLRMLNRFATHPHHDEENE